MRKAKEAEHEADAEYRSATYKLSELHNQWQSRMTMAIVEFQKLEETRLALTKHVLLEYSVINHCHMQEQAMAYDRMRERANQCNHVAELEDFVQNHGTGTQIPTPPSYSHFNQESLEDSLKRLSVRATQSPRKLYSSDDTSSLYDVQRVPFFDNNSSRNTPVSMADSNASSFASRNPRNSVISLTSSSSFSSKSAGGSFQPKPLCKVRALYSYDAQQGDEISFNEDDVISVFSVSEDPWWSGQVESNSDDDKSHKRGLFPSNYVERIG